MPSLCVATGFYTDLEILASQTALLVPVICCLPLLFLSLNADRRREELLVISRQNQAIYQRITCRQSEYRRQLWLDDWERAERRRDDISRYPRGLAEKQVNPETNIC